jgi:ribonuclease HI
MKSSFGNITAILQKSSNSKIFPKLEYLLKFDGCSKGNPGPAACGAALYQNETEIWSGSKFLGYNETNNYAEYMGLIIGLQKAVELNIKEFIENTIDIYNIRDKIDYIINKDKHFEHLLFKYNYVYEYPNNYHDNNDNNDNNIIKFDKYQLLDLLQKNDKLVVIENTNDDNKWNDNIIIIEISNLVCDKKIFIYVDLEKDENKKSQIINLDINNKIYLISHNDDVTQNYYMYILDFIKYLIEQNF